MITRNCVFLIFATLLLLGVTAVQSFCSTSTTTVGRVNVNVNVNTPAGGAVSTRLYNNNAISTTEEELSAKALSDYMAKSHEEKLKAVKRMEQQKESEIQALKAEINALKNNGALVEELNHQLIAYQKFMSNYIVESHTAKVHAVREAEAAITQKYESKLLLLQSASSSSEEEKPAVTKNIAPEGGNEKVVVIASAADVVEEKSSVAKK